MDTDEGSMGSRDVHSLIPILSPPCSNLHPQSFRVSLLAATVHSPAPRLTDSWTLAGFFATNPRFAASGAGVRLLDGQAHRRAKFYGVAFDHDKLTSGLTYLFSREESNVFS